MFDISFGEFLLIGIVALVVLGPERLPTVARTVGALVARAQRFVATVKADIQHQANLQGLDSIRQDLQEAAQNFKGQLEAEVQDARASLDSHAAEARALAEQARAPLDEAERTIHQALRTEEPAGADISPPETEAVLAEAAPPPRDENQLDLFDDLPAPVAGQPDSQPVSRA
nr:Sec-independent protein translocase protein TatB [Chromobacterium sp. ASV5]